MGERLGGEALWCHLVHTETHIQERQFLCYFSYLTIEDLFLFFYQILLVLLSYFTGLLLQSFVHVTPVDQYFR